LTGNEHQATDGGTAPDTLISVMIGAYNARPYLAEAIDSVFAQTHRPLELIVVDDGSDDGTGEVAQSYGDRLTFVRQERGGNGAARNRAVTLARGPYFAFLDADDVFTPRKLELQLAILQADPAVDVVFGHVEEFVSPELPPEVKAGIRAPAPASPWAAPNLMLARREAFERVGPFSTSLRVGVTVDWIARAKEAGLKTVVPPEVVLRRRLHTQNNGIREADARSQYLHVLKASIDRRRASQS
jgi:glycosyltransferase involved in cell wall biosynthesis